MFNAGSLASTARSAILVCAMGIASVASAHAQTKPFGPGFDGWSFTATTEKPGLVVCRATRTAGNREDILGMRNDLKPYFSVKAEGRKGKWPGTIINVPGKPRGVLEWTSTGEANGIRMWFPLPTSAVDRIVEAGAFEFSLPDTEDSGKVNLGKRAMDAWVRVHECVKANSR
ncbi:hypothetical protein [Aquabacter cavernae]|uniref:hypothetical protein n=1 Tax=Aquabacter cavernae TaxID=2496029 RepID=UPI000F8E1FC9|nr:hypothetical protein [Aquabacter cavernae]